ncbi:uncharacterized protein EHS24_004617 [Apiotrichum porosum]|uniref:Mid2 domain-containing protein n=1 Tax=Apiotrichum porosum TaxID=105984 RepID=A0A427Y5L1_9TREE|nr:uncharacterized protein EHS24_004617 [Apiotrichum porosum]RSH86368.1 hypothetical protein EHS24_004617 [Apiotrichum porosum]
MQPTCAEAFTTNHLIFALISSLTSTSLLVTTLDSAQEWENECFPDAPAVTSAVQNLPSNDPVAAGASPEPPTASDPQVISIPNGAAASPSSSGAARVTPTDIPLPTATLADDTALVMADESTTSSGRKKSTSTVYVLASATSPTHTSTTQIKYTSIEYVTVTSDNVVHTTQSAVVVYGNNKSNAAVIAGGAAGGAVGLGLLVALMWFLWRRHHRGVAYDRDIFDPNMTHSHYSTENGSEDEKVEAPMSPMSTTTAANGFYPPDKKEATSPTPSDGFDWQSPFSPTSPVSPGGPRSPQMGSRSPPMSPPTSSEGGTSPWGPAVVLPATYGRRPSVRRGSTDRTSSSFLVPPPPTRPPRRVAQPTSPCSTARPISELSHYSEPSVYSHSVHSGYSHPEEAHYYTEEREGEVQRQSWMSLHPPPHTPPPPTPATSPPPTSMSAVEARRRQAAAVRDQRLSDMGVIPPVSPSATPVAAQPPAPSVSPPLPVGSPTSNRGPVIVSPIGSSTSLSSYGMHELSSPITALPSGHSAAARSNIPLGMRSDPAIACIAPYVPGVTARGPPARVAADNESLLSGYSEDQLAGSTDAGHWDPSPPQPLFAEFPTPNHRRNSPVGSADVPSDVSIGSAAVGPPGPPSPHIFQHTDMAVAQQNAIAATAAATPAPPERPPRPERLPPKYNSARSRGDVI